MKKRKVKKNQKIRNDNFYKYNIKHINIFVGDVNPNLDSYDNTMFNNINISKEKTGQNTIEYNNQIFDISQTKKVENNYEVKTIDSFNQTKNGNILTKTKNFQSINLPNKNTDIYKDYIRFDNYLNTKKPKLQKYKTLIERSKTKESEKNIIKSNVKYKRNFNLKFDNYLQSKKNNDFKKRLFSDPNLI